MAREFGTYSPKVPLNATWNEAIILEDSEGVPIDLTGFDVRAQLYVERPLRNPMTGAPIVAPVAELTTEDFYVVNPSWPVFEGAAEIPAPPTDGLLTTEVSVAQLWTLSPTNEKVKLFWSIMLVNKTTGVAIPVVTGRPTFLPNNTI